MEVQRRRWTVLVATIWIQAFTGTNFDFSAYSPNLKSVLQISQVQLNYLAVASDMGKAFGWSSGLALLRFPIWSVLLAAATMGLVGYFIQWLLLAGLVDLPYFLVTLLCLLSGCSICWFNTVCFVLCTRNFPTNRSLALSLSVSFNGVSAALYTLIANAVASSYPDQSLYLLLNAIVPLITSFLALIPILNQPPPQSHHSHHDDSWIFYILFFLASITGAYLLFLNSSTSYNHVTAWALLAGAIVLLVLPLVVPSVVSVKGDTYKDVELELQKRLFNDNSDEKMKFTSSGRHGKGSLVVLGEEHSLRDLVRSFDFWLYYFAYSCGATVGLVYSNNLGQIAESLGRASETSMLISVYSACSFFGRLLSSAPDFLQGCHQRLSFFGEKRKRFHAWIKRKRGRKMCFARTGWLAMMLVPMPFTFFLLAHSGNGQTLLVGTAVIGLSSGFIFAAAVSVTSELFGPNSIGLNHNILITNIPLGSLLYGLLAAIIYDYNGNSTFSHIMFGKGVVICMGTSCYSTTFIAWGCITLLGLLSSTALFLRTRSAYERIELKQTMSVLN